MVNLNHLKIPQKGHMLLFLWMLLMPAVVWAQSNTATVSWNSQVGCIDYYSEVEDPKHPSEPSNGIVFESLAPGQKCQRVCESSSVQYTVTGNNIANVTWNVSGGSVTSTSGTNNSVAWIHWSSSGNGALSVTITYTDQTQQTSTLCVEKAIRPVAEFQIAGQLEPVFCVGSTVNFDNLSNSNGGSAIVHYQWSIESSFGGGVFSTLFEPSYTFTQAGNYNVTLAVTNSCNCTSYYNMEIRIEGGPPVDITCNSVTCEGNTETYTANDICSGKWDVIGGTIVSQNGNSIDVVWDHVDPEEGFGYVMYRSECGCQQWTSIKVPVVLKEGKIKGQDGICVGKQSLYSLPQWPTTNVIWHISGNSGGNAYLTYTANRNEVYVTAQDAGTYTLTASYYNTLLGCSGEASFTITASEPVHITGGQNEVCAGTQQVFTTQPGLSAYWTITRNNSVVYNTNGVSATYTFALPGVYVVTATRPGGCISEPFVVNVTQAPAAPSGTISGETVICPGIAYVYTLSSIDPGMIPVWEVTGGSIQGSNTGATVTVVFAAGAPNYIVRVKNQTAGTLACVSTSEKTLVAQPIDLGNIFITHVGNQPFCPSSSILFNVHLNGIVPDHTEWSFVDINTNQPLPTFGSILPDPANPYNAIIQFNEVTNSVTSAKVVLKIVKCGMTEFIYKDVSILATPTLTFANPGNMCLGSTLTFQVNSSLPNAGGTMTFTFSNGSSHSMPFQPGGIYTFPNNGYITNNSTFINGSITESVTATLDVGLCENYVVSAGVMFNVFPETKISITPGYHYTICDPNNYQPITLNGNVSTGITSTTELQWYFNNNPIAGATTNTYTISSNTPYGTYYLQVKDANGCIAKSQVITVSNANCTPGCEPPIGIDPVVSTTWTGCTTASASLQGTIGSPTSITWVPSPMMTLTGGQGTANATFSTTVAGAHTATAVLDYNGCKVSVSGTVIKRYEPKLSVQVICDSSQSTYNVVVHNSSSVFDINPALITYTYKETGTGTQFSGQNMQSATFTGLAPGVYTFTLQLSSAGNPVCTVTQTITLPQIPNVAFSLASGQYCVGEPITLEIPNYNPVNDYMWKFGTTTFIPTQAVTQITINQPIPLTITLYAESPFGCTYFHSIPITVVDADFDGTLFPNAINVCEDSSVPTVTFTPNGQAPNSFIWMNGNTPVPNATTTGSFTPTESGSYWPVLVAANGCKDYKMSESPANVVIKSKPYVNISGKANLCAGSNTTLHGMVTDTTLEYQWLYGSTVVQPWSTTYPIELNTGALAAGNHTYTLQVRPVAPGDPTCGSEKSFTITVSNPPAPVSISYSITNCQPYEVQLTANGPTNGTYLWSNGMFGKTITVSVGGMYGVMYTAPSGCTTSSEEMVPHSLESLMWIFPTGCYDFCRGEGRYVIGPRGDYPYHEWQYFGNNNQSGSGYIYPYWPAVAGSYSLMIDSGVCQFTSGTMNMMPNPECGIEPTCEIKGHIDFVKGEQSPYEVYGVLYNYGSSAVTLNISSAGNNGVYIPSTIMIPPGGSYDFMNNPILFYPAPGYTGGYDSMLLVNPYWPECKFELEVPFPDMEGKHAAPVAPSVKATMSLAPNPVKAQTTVRYDTGDPAKKARMMLVHDAMGNVKYRKELDASKGQIELQVATWLQGVYIVTIVTEDRPLQSKLLKE